MPCIYNGCSDAILQGSDAWGLSAGVCQKHFEKAKELCTNNLRGAPIDKLLHEDYAKIYILLDVDRARVEECLQALASEIGNLEGRAGYQSSKPGKGHIKLSAALERYETYTWFPQCRETFIAQLPSERFLSYLKLGLMAKDPGAGPNHGDFTHRIHWNIVARVVTLGFTRPRRPGWNHTPLKLFTFLGEGPAVDQNIWSKLFEEGKGTNRFPDTLNAKICTGNYGALSVNMGRRFGKRDSEFQAQLDPEEVKRVDDSKWITRTVTVNGVDKQVTKNEKQWLTLDTLAKAGNAYAERTRAKYNQLGNDPVLNRGAIAATLSIQERIAQSYGGFNNNFSDATGKLVYSDKLGVIKLKGISSMRRGLLSNRVVDIV